MTDVAVVIVTYNSEGLIRSCLDALAQNTHVVTYEVLVVDNASQDRTVQILRDEYPSAKVHVNDSNLGFAAATNRGIRMAAADYLMLLNPDAVIEDGALDRLHAVLEALSSYAAAAPQLLNPDGTVQYSIRNFPTLRNQCFELLGLSRVFPGLSMRWGEVVVAPDAYNTQRPVEWVSGAAALVRSTTFSMVGHLDEEYFMYSEETDWFRRVADAGLYTLFVPDARVTHASRKSAGNPQLYGMLVRSRVMYFKRSHTRPVADALILATALFLLSRMFAWSIIARVRPGGSARLAVDSYRIGLRALIAKRGQP